VDRERRRVFPLVDRPRLIDRDRTTRTDPRPSGTRNIGARQVGFDRNDPRYGKHYTIDLNVSEITTVLFSLSRTSKDPNAPEGEREAAKRVSDEIDRQTPR
jgi:hypothetical protein